MPGYIRGKVGQIVRVHGVHMYLDSNANGEGEDPRWLYGVEFPGKELWGGYVTTASNVMVDCWEPYLEPHDIDQKPG